MEGKVCARGCNRGRRRFVVEKLMQAKMDARDLLEVFGGRAPVHGVMGGQLSIGSSGSAFVEHECSCFQRLEVSQASFWKSLDALALNALHL